MSKLLHKAFFVIRYRYWRSLQNSTRKRWYSFLGMQLGSGTTLSKVHVTWPHQIAIGNNCILEHDIYFKYDGVWQPGAAIQIKDQIFIGAGCEFNIQKGITIGSHSLIASGCRFIDHDHGTAAGTLMHSQQGAEKEIVIGRDVWLGCGVVVLKGVVIGDGAVVAAGAVVTKSIPPQEIWAGVPAKKIGQRT